MSIVRRMKAHKIGRLDVPAQAAWDLLTDWAGLLRWLPKGVANLQRVELENGSTDIPRTRILWNTDGSCVREKLLHQDDLARRIYYMVEGEAIPGVRNYLASATVGELGPTTCEMEFLSSFDVLDPQVDAERCRLIFESVYANCFLRGFSDCLRGSG
jgi:hypothetical protein